jgi:hypothetical protein
MELRGAKTMQRKLETMARRFPDRVAGALRIEAELVMTRSKREFVPVDLGVLRSSGHVRDPERQGKEVSVTMAYGGAAAAYATAVHEHPSGSSPPSWQGKTVHFSPDGRGPKYLERPMREAIPGMAERMAARLQEAIAKDSQG